MWSKAEVEMEIRKAHGGRPIAEIVSEVAAQADPKEPAHPEAERLVWKIHPLAGLDGHYVILLFDRILRQRKEQSA